MLKLFRRGSKISMYPLISDPQLNQKQRFDVRMESFLSPNLDTVWLKKRLFFKVFSFLKELQFYSELKFCKDILQFKKMN